jgi:hypothetical protein
MTARYVMVSRDDETLICERCLLAESAWLRVRGLLGRDDLPEGDGILLRPASSIHMFFMRFPIDAVFLDRELNVLRIRAGLAPWRVAAKRRACSVLELPAGSCARRGVHEGDRLRIKLREC